jgi:hypothetical protein
MSDRLPTPLIDAVAHCFRTKRRAVEDAGVEESSIDAFLLCRMEQEERPAGRHRKSWSSAPDVAPTFRDGAMTGGSSAELHVAHVASAIESSTPARTRQPEQRLAEHGEVTLPIVSR